jgi:hypothetical protein
MTAIVFAGLFIYGTYRTRRGKAIPMDEQALAVAMEGLSDSERSDLLNQNFD